MSPGMLRRDISRRFIIIIYLFIIMNRITNRIDSNRELECSSGHRRKHTRTEARTDRRTTRKHNAICRLVGDTTATTITIAIRNWQQNDGEGKAFSAAARIQSGPKITEVALFFLFLLFGNTLLLTIFLLTLSVSSLQNTIRGCATQMQSAMCRSDGRTWPKSPFGTCRLQHSITWWHSSYTHSGVVGEFVDL